MCSISLVLIMLLCTGTPTPRCLQSQYLTATCRGKKELLEFGAGISSRGSTRSCRTFTMTVTSVTLAGGATWSTLMRCRRHPVTGPASSSLRHHAGARAFLVGLAINHMHACMVFSIPLGSRSFFELHFFHHFFKACQLFQHSIIISLHELNTVGILLNDPQLLYSSIPGTDICFHVFIWPSLVYLSIKTKRDMFLLLPPTIWDGVFLN